MSNVFSNNNFDKCVGCGACESTCPQKAIEMRRDDLGFDKPFLVGKCINCGLCTKVCSIYQDNHNRDKSILKCYSASSNDNAVLSCSSSGGVSYHLMKELLKRGYSIIGCAYDATSKEAFHCAAKSLNEIYMFQGSKYFKSDFKPAIRYLIQNKDKKIAFFGLPCQIKSIMLLSDFYNIDHSNIFLVSLMCFGVASPLLWKKYLNEVVSKKIKSEILDVKFRSKYYGWHRSTLEFHTSKNKYISNPIDNEFLELYYSRFFFNDSCYSCNVRKEFLYEDIRIGDFWGDLYQNNKTGKSGVIICTTNGEKIFNSIKDEMDFKEEEIDDFTKYQSLDNLYAIDQTERYKMRDTLINNSMHSLIKEYKKNHFTIKQRIMKFLWIIKRKILNHEPKFKKIDYE